MTHHRKVTSLLAVAAAAATALLVTAGPAPAQAVGPQVVFLRGGALVRVAPTAPGTVIANVTITGLGVGDRLAGIDVRPADGKLYGIGTSGVIYTVDPVTGAVAAGPTAATAPTGTSFGVDFNPVADRLRVVSDTGQSLRINVTDGATTVDGSLAYGATDPGAGTTPTVTGAAYTNPDNDAATATELFDIESARDVLVLQAPPNDGTLATRGPLGRDAGTVGGFDISSDGTALAVFGATVVRVDLADGSTDVVGTVPGGSVDGLAFVPALGAPTTTSTTPTSTTPTTTTPTTTAPTTVTTRVAEIPKTGDQLWQMGASGVLLVALGGIVLALAANRRALDRLG